MSRKYKFHEQDELYFLTFAVINWIDLFIRKEYKQVMLDSCSSARDYCGVKGNVAGKVCRGFDSLKTRIIMKDSLIQGTSTQPHTAEGCILALKGLKSIR